MSKRIGRSPLLHRSLVAAIAVAALAVQASGASAAVASPETEATAEAPNHDLLSERGERTQRARALAVAKVAAGQATPETRGSSQRIEYRAGSYAETARTADRIFVLPVEFSDYTHNRIPEPDRATDNATVWTRDYSRAYYQRQIFGTADQAAGDTLRSYFQRQSSGVYSITGTVQDWTRVDRPLRTTAPTPAGRTASPSRRTTATSSSSPTVSTSGTRTSARRAGPPPRWPSTLPRTTPGTATTTTGTGSSTNPTAISTA